ncbi:MAG: ABC transporter permease [Chloroflexi bacterium]|nr:ABC transporter permease [Chloroflexota bacterium]
MMNLLFLARRYMGQRRTRAVLTILAIVFGTATLYAANTTPGAVQAAAERTALGEDGLTLTIAQGFTGQSEPLSESQVPVLESLAGVESASFSAEGTERDNTISLKLAPGASLTDVAQAVESAIGDYSVLGIDPRRSLLQNQFYQVLFNFFGGISLLIGSFLIYVTIRTSAAERRRELGILRAIGADQGQVVRLFTLEALLLAVIGTIVGMIVGQLFAIGMFQMVWSASFQMYEQEGGVPLNLPALLAAAAIGIAVSLTAAYFPARAASRITPIEAIRQEAPAVTLRAARWRILLGLLVTVVSILVLISGTAWSALGGLLLFISAALLAPALLLPAVGALRPIFTRLFPRLADLVYAGILRQPWRAATTLSVLTIGFALCVGVMGLISQTVADTAERINAQDPDRDLALYGMEQGLPDRVALSVGELPEADAVARVYHVTATADGQPVLVESVDTRHGNRLRSFNRLLSGEEPDPPYLDNAAADAIVDSLADGRRAIISYRLSQLTGASGRRAPSSSTRLGDRAPTRWSPSQTISGRRRTIGWPISLSQLCWPISRKQRCGQFTSAWPTYDRPHHSLNRSAPRSSRRKRRCSSATRWPSASG